MSNNERFNELFQRAQTTSGASGKYDSKLDPATRQLLTEFVTWLKADGKSDATARSYRSYMAKAIAEPTAKLTSDQRSAIRKFEEFVKRPTK
jgi:hypothetical protein